MQAENIRLKIVQFIHKEAYIESSRTNMAEPFCRFLVVNYFRRKALL